MVAWVEQMTLDSVVHHLLPHYHLHHLSHLYKMADWSVVVRVLPATLFVVRVHHMELPSFQESLLLYG